VVNKHVDLGIICNGVLCGFVAITAPCAVASKPASVAIGFAASFVVYPVCVAATRRIKLDDPVEAISVHAGCGLFGVLVVAFCKPNCDYIAAVGGGLLEQKRFCAEDHNMGKQLVAQAWGALTELWWTTAVSVVLWGALVIHEVAIALEDELLADVLQLLWQSHLGDPPAEAKAALKTAIRRSQVAREILQQNGWSLDGKRQDDHKARSHLLCICSLLQKARENSRSALEIKDRRIIRCLAQVWRKSACAHRLGPLRLRILPSAELSGLGATDIDGGKILRKARRLIVDLAAENWSVHEASQETLKKEVEELNELVQSQDLLVKTLTKHGRRARNSLGSHESSGGISTPSSASSRGGISNAASNVSPGPSRENSDCPLLMQSAVAEGMPQGTSAHDILQVLAVVKNQQERMYTMQREAGGR
jgi:hypothetical protein